MENYQVNKTFGFVRLPFAVSSNNDESFDEFRKSVAVDNLLKKEVTAINDYEVTAFKPVYPEIQYDIFFHKRLQNPANPAASDLISQIMSTAFETYYWEIMDYFGSDPAITGDTYPTFWNSFGYPFFTKLQDWYVNGTLGGQLKPKRFDPNSYLYNSFIKMNFYTTPYPNTQELLFQSVIFVNPRWCLLEGDANGSWHRPTFVLNDTTDGYFLYWLNNYNIGTFYVNFQFWDALNGKMINLMPTSKVTPYKQWVQSVNLAPLFDPKMIYMECNVQYSNKTYRMSEYNPDTGLWDIHEPNIQLYEIVFDDYFAPRKPNIPAVVNGEYTQSIVVPPATTDFTIKITGQNKQLLTSPDDLFTVESSDSDTKTFHDVREEFHMDIVSLPDKSEQEITITNQSDVPIYLKDIQLIKLEETGSSRGFRLSSVNKNQTVPNQTLYTFYSVPTPNIEYIQSGDLTSSNRSMALQPYFDLAYTTRYGKEYSAGNDDEFTSGKPWWESENLFGWYYPITPTNFDSWAPMFSEQLYVLFKQTDLDEIIPNGSMKLYLDWGLGNSYQQVYIEPDYYEICRYGSKTTDQDYHINLKYHLRLVFNNLQNTLPETANTVDIIVPVSYTIGYKYTYDGGGHGGGSGSGTRPV